MFDNCQSLTNSLCHCPSRYCVQAGVVVCAHAATSRLGTTHNVVIVGSGAAGCTAANRNCAGGSRTGANRLAHCGVLMQTTGAENFPGFVDGIDGPDLMSDLYKRAKRFGTATIPADEPEIPALGTRVGRVGAHASARLAHR
jgi:thioredoxin reductase (NADPH)